jgi:chemotaxis protein histidine kinase CheA
VLRATDVLTRVLRSDGVTTEEGIAALKAATSDLEAGGGADRFDDARVDATATRGDDDSDGNAAPQTGAQSKAARWIQVEAKRVDELVSRVAHLQAELGRLQAQVRASAAARDRDLGETLERCRLVLDDVSSASWGLRPVPVEPTLVDLLRHARELAIVQGKRVQVSVEAGGALIERNVLHALGEPLLHLVRNAIDHGIELPDERGAKPPDARLRLRAEAVGSDVVITVIDDGRGVDSARVRRVAVERGLLSTEAAERLTEEESIELLFHHGFSTATEVSELSGRGVGLDVVREQVTALGGTVTLRSRRGEGTEITLALPSRITQERALVVDCGGVLFGIASRHVAEVSRRGDHPIEPVAGGRIVRRHDVPVPLRSLAGTLGYAVADEPWILFVTVGARTIALAVPGLVGEHELVRQPVDRLLARNPHVGASATLPDGRLVLLLVLGHLLERRETAHAPVETTSRRAMRSLRVLVVDDSDIVRDLVAQVLRAAGHDVATAHNGAVALGMLDTVRPELIVTDVEMPVMDGFELLRHVRLRDPKLPCILLTSRSSPADHRRSIELGASAHLVKSTFRDETLLETVRRVVNVQ